MNVITRKELRDKRIKLGLTQIKFAELLGVTSNTVARWERGELKIGCEKMLILALKNLIK